MPCMIANGVRGPTGSDPFLNGEAFSSIEPRVCVAYDVSIDGWIVRYKEAPKHASDSPACLNGSVFTVIHGNHLCAQRPELIDDRP